MTDNKNTKDGRDRSKVDSQDSSEVEYLHSQFPDLSHKAIVEAIEAVGPGRAKIIKYIKKKHSK
ncbi:MAG: DUF3606 domain-containing protein [Ferruginibacter sp.]